MSQYNTAQETTAKAKTLTKADNRGDYIMKGDTSENHESIIRNLFNALFVSERQHSIKADHTPTHPTMMTLDIYQVQQLIQSHCGKLITHMEIVDALYDLEEPKLLQPSKIAFNSELDGKRIDAIRLEYGHFNKAIPIEKSKTDEIALELSQVTFNHTADEIDKCDASRRWIERAMYLEESHIEQQDTIQSLRTIIIDMAETLHVADPNARISMTSSDLLDLVHSQKDMSDNAF
ncbi:hypothetical protein ACTXGO_01320 [Psychrobacter sp. T6-1]|uniref:hypothetical protein n=1 Tax=Psychrobacter sp. T6-1 TaxID=3457447 RepID=UPI003FD505DC